MTQCMNCNQSVTVGKVVCSDCVDLIEQQQAEISALKAEMQGVRANSAIQEQIIKNCGSPFANDAIIRLIMEKTVLQAHNKEAMELLGLARSTLNDMAECDSCEHAYDCPYNHGYRIAMAGNVKVPCSDCYQWQHADRYETLKISKENLEKEVENEQAHDFKLQTQK